MEGTTTWHEYCTVAPLVSKASVHCRVCVVSVHVHTTVTNEERAIDTRLHDHGTISLLHDLSVTVTDVFHR